MLCRKLAKRQLERGIEVDLLVRSELDLVQAYSRGVTATILLSSVETGGNRFVDSSRDI